MLSIMVPEEPGLDIAGPTAESHRALYRPPGTIISWRISTGSSMYFQALLRPTSRWLNSVLAIGIAGIESDPSGPTSALSDEPSGHAKGRPGAEERMA